MKQPELAQYRFGDVWRGIDDGHRSERCSRRVLPPARLSLARPDIEGTLIVSQPSADPDLWDDTRPAPFVATASVVSRVRSTSRRCATVPTPSCSAQSSTMPERWSRPAGQSAAISRRLTSVEEWAGQPGQQAVRQIIDERVPYGVLEMKAGWVTDAPDRNPLLTSALARSCFYMMVMLDFQFGMCTAATAI